MNNYDKEILERLTRIEENTRHTKERVEDIEEKIEPLTVHMHRVRGLGKLITLLLTSGGAATILVRLFL